LIGVAAHDAAPVADDADDADDEDDEVQMWQQAEEWASDTDSDAEVDSEGSDSDDDDHELEDEIEEVKQAPDMDQIPAAAAVLDPALLNAAAAHPDAMQDGALLLVQDDQLLRRTQAAVLSACEPATAYQRVADWHEGRKFSVTGTVGHALLRCLNAVQSAGSTAADEKAFWDCCSFSWFERRHLSTDAMKLGSVRATLYFVCCAAGDAVYCRTGQ